MGGIKLRLWGSSSLCALGWQYVGKGIILVFKEQVVSVGVMLMQSAKGIIGFLCVCVCVLKFMDCLINEKKAIKYAFGCGWFYLFLKGTC